MDIASIVGMVVGLGSLIVAYTLEGGSLKSLVQVSSILIVFGGAFGAVALSYGVHELIKMPKLFMQAFIPPRSTINKTIDYIVMLSENARKEGLLSIEKIIEEQGPKSKVDPFLKRGMLMVIDGTDLEQIREVMEKELQVYEERAKGEIGTFEAYAGFGPAFGMVGTIMGMIQVLSNMESAEEMTSAIAVAFVATLYGVASANVIFIPTANKLKLRLKQYLLEKEMIIEGVCGIRNGMNPKMLRDKLSIYMQRKPRNKGNTGKGGE